MEASGGGVWFTAAVEFARQVTEECVYFGVVADEKFAHGVRAVRPAGPTAESDETSSREILD